MHRWLNGNATNHVGADTVELKKLLDSIRESVKYLDSENQEAVSECLEVIENESTSEKPKKSMVKTALSTLSAIKGTAEFGAAVTALVQFVAPLL